MVPLPNCEISELTHFDYGLSNKYSNRTVTFQSVQVSYVVNHVIMQMGL